MTLSGVFLKWFGRRTPMSSALQFAGLALAILLARPCAAQAQESGVPWDWSHHHLIFSQPKTAEDEAPVKRDPRYRHQGQYRNASAQAEPEVTEAAIFQAAAAKKKATGLWGESFSGTTAGTVGAGNYPAKWSFSNTASCSDFVAYNTSLAGTAGQSSIVAYNNIYTSGASSCGTNPTVYWAYDTGGTISSSVSVSEDGSQLVFLHTPTSGAASVVVLHWHAGDGSVSSPMALTNQSGGAAYASCRASSTAACMYTIALGNGKSASHAPWYDYGSDTLYVGDNSGYLHKFTGVFHGSPAESTSSGGWPVHASTETSPALTSPVYDPTSTLVFVGDASGYLHSVTTTGSSSQTVSTSNQLEHATGGFADAPLVDSGTELVYAFVAYSGDTNNPSYVNRFAAGSSISNSYGTSVNLGNGNSITNSASSAMYIGAFDNTYYTGSGTTGNLYVCENGVLFQIPMSGFNSHSTYDQAVSNVSSSATCSPISEIYNAGKDWLFLSVASSGNATNCSGACLYNYNVASGATSGIATAGLASAGGSSGIVVDNTAAGGGSQIYFTYQTPATGSIPCQAPSNATSGGCALQASQAGLK